MINWAGILNKVNLSYIGLMGGRVSVIADVRHYRVKYSVHAMNIEIQNVIS
jgi:hypothetical protein